MNNRDNVNDQKSETSPVDELKQLAFMYHVFGNYAKSDEIMGVVYDLEAKRAERIKRRRDAAA